VQSWKASCKGRRPKRRERRADGAAVPRLPASSLLARHALAAADARAELDNLFLDAALLAVWCAELGFPTWITYAFIGAT
jgi:hypothetical protein